jgi:hypothetical protein
MVIPSNITRDHVISALKEIRNQNIPPVYQYRRYTLEFEGKRYPPRYAISIANKYANGNILEHSKIGSKEAVSLLDSMGFSILDLSDGESNINEPSYIPVTDKAPEVQNYLKNTYSISVNKAKGFRSGLTLPSGAVIHVSGSKQYLHGGGFYALTFNKYKDLESNANAFYAIVLDKPENTFVLPQLKVKQIFSGVNPGEDKKWHYDIRKEDGHYILIPSNDTRNIGSEFIIRRYYDLSIQYYDTAIDIDSDGSYAWYGKGLALGKMGKSIVD